MSRSKVLARAARVVGAAFLIAAILSFWLFHAVNGHLSLASQAWRYVSSGLFKLLTAGLLLPMVLLFGADYSDIAKTLQERRDRREELQQQELAEGRRTFCADRKADRASCLAATSEAIVALHGIAARVVYMDATARDGDPQLQDLQREAYSFIPLVNKTISLWSSGLEEVADVEVNGISVQWIFVGFMQTLIWAISSTVFYMLKDGVTADERLLLQLELDEIADGVRAALHWNTLRVLSDASRILAISDEALTDGDGEGRKAPAAALKEALETRLTAMAGQLARLRQLEEEHNEPMPLLEGTEADAWRSTWEEILKKRRKRPPVAARPGASEFAPASTAGSEGTDAASSIGRRPEDDTAKAAAAVSGSDGNPYELQEAETQQLHDAFISIPPKSRLLASRVHYSREFIRLLAGWFLEERLLLNLNRALERMGHADTRDSVS
jgi:hypothetical protein